MGQIGLIRRIGWIRGINDKLTAINGELFNGPLMGINGDITAGGAIRSSAQATGFRFATALSAQSAPALRFTSPERVLTENRNK